MAAPDNWIWDTAPDCIVRDVQPGIPYLFDPDGGQYLLKPYEDCTGFFTFGPGTEWAGAAYAFIPVPEGGSV